MSSNTELNINSSINYSTKLQEQLDDIYMEISNLCSQSNLTITQKSQMHLLSEQARVIVKKIKENSAAVSLYEDSLLSMDNYDNIEQDIFNKTLPMHSFLDDNINKNTVFGISQQIPTIDIQFVYLGLKTLPANSIKVRLRIFNDDMLIDDNYYLPVNNAPLVSGSVFGVNFTNIILPSEQSVCSIQHDVILISDNSVIVSYSREGLKIG